MGTKLETGGPTAPLAPAAPAGGGTKGAVTVAYAVTVLAATAAHLCWTQQSSCTQSMPLGIAIVGKRHTFGPSTPHTLHTCFRACPTPAPHPPARPPHICPTLSHTRHTQAHPSQPSGTQLHRTPCTPAPHPLHTRSTSAPHQLPTAPHLPHTCPHIHPHTCLPAHLSVPAPHKPHTRPKPAPAPAPHKQHTSPTPTSYQTPHQPNIAPSQRTCRSRLDKRRCDQRLPFGQTRDLLTASTSSCGSRLEVQEYACEGEEEGGGRQGGEGQGASTWCCGYWFIVVKRCRNTPAREG